MRRSVALTQHGVHQKFPQAGVAQRIFQQREQRASWREARQHREQRLDRDHLFGVAGIRRSDGGLEQNRGVQLCRRPDDHAVVLLLNHAAALDAEHAIKGALSYVFRERPGRRSQAGEKRMRGLTQSFDPAAQVAGAATVVLIDGAEKLRFAPDILPPHVLHREHRESDPLSVAKIDSLSRFHAARGGQIHVEHHRQRKGAIRRPAADAPARLRSRLDS